MNKDALFLIKLQTDTFLKFRKKITVLESVFNEVTDWKHNINDKLLAPFDFLLHRL